MNKNGKQVNAMGVTMVVILLGILATVVLFGTNVLKLPVSESVVSQSTVQAGQIAEATKVGDVSSLGVQVRDISNNNQNTKVAVAVYCQDDTGAFIIDATTSSTSAEITGRTEIGRTVTCWAFNSTYQSEPVVQKIDGESPHIVISAFRVPTNAKIQFYNDQYNTGYLTANVTVGASGTGTLQKMRFTNNNTDTIYPLGGFYLDVAEATNITVIDMAGGVILSGMDKTSSLLVDSSVSTGVSARKTKWEYVFEIDDDASESGNQALLLEENDYLETGSISVTGDGDGCVTAGEDIAPYAFVRGYYRSATDGVKYGIETDSQTPAVIVSDSVGDILVCN